MLKMFRRRAPEVTAPVAPDVKASAPSEVTRSGEGVR